MTSSNLREGYDDTEPTHICGFIYINYKPIGVYQIWKKIRRGKIKLTLPSDLNLGCGILRQSNLTATTTTKDDKLRNKERGFGFVELSI